MVSVYRRGTNGDRQQDEEVVDSREGRIELLQQDAKVILNLNGSVVWHLYSLSRQAAQVGRSEEGLVVASFYNDQVKKQTRGKQHA